MPTEEINILNIDAEPSQPEGFDVQLDIQQPSSPTLNLGVVLPIGEGGAIKSISVNGVEQPIIEGNVDIIVPTSTSQLLNDSGYITSSAITGKVDRTELAQVAFTGDYDDLQNKPEIPSLSGYATETYVGNAVSAHNESTTAHTDIRNEISAIDELIPAQAASDNQLADKNFVNSSIATSTATFRGTYNVVTDLNLHYNSTHSEIALKLGTEVSTADNNDYVFVQIPTSDSTPTEIASIERYKYNGSVWEYEYTLNNSGFTAAQWAAINSGITSTAVSQIATNTNDISNLQTSVNGKVSKTGDTMSGNLEFDEGKSVILKGSSYWMKIIQSATNIYITSSSNQGQTWSTPILYIYNTQNKALFRGDVFVGGASNTENKLQRYDEIYVNGIVSDTKTWSTDADGKYYYTVSDPVSGPIPKSFITEWNTKAGLYGSIALPRAFNPTTGYFELNGLYDITYEEAIVILYESSMITMNNTNYPYSRTNLGIRTNSVSIGRQWQNTNSEVAYFANATLSLESTTTSTTFLNGSKRLREIIYAHLSSIAGTLQITDCPSLTTITLAGSIYGAAGNLTLTGCPNLSLQSMVTLVNTAQNTAAKTYKVAGNTWTSCQNDTTEYTHSGQTYTGIIAYAAAKNITITN